MQNTGKTFLSEERFSEEFLSSNILCPITSYELIYGNKEDQSQFISIAPDEKEMII